MTVGIWMTLASIIIPSAITLIAGYWQVKTARAVAKPVQKEDSTNTNVRITSRRKRSDRNWNIFVLTAIAYNLGSVVFNLTKPLSKFSMFGVAFGLVMVSILCEMYVVFRVSDRHREAIFIIKDVIDMHINQTTQNAKDVHRNLQLLNPLSSQPLINQTLIAALELLLVSGKET